MISQYSSSYEYIAIYNPKTIDLKIHKISNKECMLCHTFSLASNIFLQDQQEQQQIKVKELHWMDDNNTLIVWIEEDKTKNYVKIYDLSLGREIGKIILSQKDDGEILAIRSNPNNNSVYVFIKRKGKERKYRIVCQHFTKEGKSTNKVKLARIKINSSKNKEKKDVTTFCIGKTLNTATDDENNNNPTALIYDGKKIKSYNLNTGTNNFELEVDTVLEQNDDDSNTIVDLSFYNNNMLWIRTSQGMIILYNIKEKNIEGRIVIDTNEDEESLQNIISKNNFILLSYQSKVLLYQTLPSIKLLSTFKMKTLQEKDQCLLGGCIDKNHVHFCFYLMNMNQVRSERICFLNDNDKDASSILTPSTVIIGEDGVDNTATGSAVTSLTTTDDDGNDDKPIVKQPNVLSLSQTGPKRSPEMNIIPTTNKRTKLNDDDDTENKNSDDEFDDDDGLTIQQILQKQLLEQREEYISKQKEEPAITATTIIPSTKSLSTILTQTLTSYDEQTFHSTILNNTKPTQDILKQTLSSLEHKYIPILLNKLTTSVQSNHKHLNKVLAWIREIIFFVCGNKDSIPSDVMNDFKNELVLWRNVAEKRVRYYDDFAGLSSRLDLMINVSKYRIKK